MPFPAVASVATATLSAPTPSRDHFCAAGFPVRFHCLSSAWKWRRRHSLGLREEQQEAKARERKRKSAADGGKRVYPIFFGNFLEWYLCSFCFLCAFSFSCFCYQGVCLCGTVMRIRFQCVAYSPSLLYDNIEYQRGKNRRKRILFACV